MSILCKLVIGLFSIIISFCTTENREFGFSNVPNDSTILDMHDLVLPGVGIDITFARKKSDNYLLSLHADYNGMYGSDMKKSFLIELNKRKRSYISIPDCSVSEWQSDSPEPYRTCLYEDHEWRVMAIDNGEFGLGTWFIDQLSGKEYLMIGICRDLYRINGVFYIVNISGIFVLNNPTSGFICNDATSFEKAKDERFLFSLFRREGLSKELIDSKHIISPIIRFDDFVDIFPTSRIDAAFSDTIICSSFKASDTLYCIVETTSDIKLTKLDENRLVNLHSFIKKDIVSIHKYKDDERPQDERLLILFRNGKNSYDLVDIGPKGNYTIRIKYDQGPIIVESDHIEELLSYYLERAHLSITDIDKKEKSIGGRLYFKVSEPGPPVTIWSEDESFLCYKYTRKVKDKYQMDTHYWVCESDESVNAVYLILEWAHTNPETAESKYDEMTGVIDRIIGDPVKRKRYESGSLYSEWHYNHTTIKCIGHTTPINSVLITIY